jgi:GT2 family glycosyltransferase
MKATPPPRISVIVPTYNRCEQLRLTLESLATQRFPTEEFEVVVSDDGSSDATAEMVRSFTGRLRLRYRFQEDRGFRTATARNAGARLAASPVLAFLDAGTLAGPDFVRGHLAARPAGCRPRAVVGYCYGYGLPGEVPGLAAALEELAPAQVAQRYGSDPSFMDLRHEVFEQACFDLGEFAAPWCLFWAMNCSVEAEAFWLVGGFDERFRSWGGEDIELGYRLFQAHHHFVVSREAWSIEKPSQPDMKAISESSERNTLRILSMHCEPVVELFFAAEPSKDTFRTEGNIAALRSWAQAAAELEVRAEIDAAAADVPAGASVAIFGCGGAVPSSLPPSILLDFDSELLASALADGRHTGYQLIGLRTPLDTGSVDVVIITSRLSGLWDRWDSLVLAEAHRIGRQVRGPAIPGNAPRRSPSEIGSGRRAG